MVKLILRQSRLVQRLVQKEKEVTQLQAELDRLSCRISNNARDAVSMENNFAEQLFKYLTQEEQARKERERARLHSLHEEVNKLQHQVRYLLISHNLVLRA